MSTKPGHGHEWDGLRIDEHTAFPQWDGLPANYSRVVDVLMDPPADPLP